MSLLIQLQLVIPSVGETITLPLPPPSGSLVYNNDWGDGNITNSIIHIYTSPGSYTVTVNVTSGSVTQFGSEDTPWDILGGIYLTSVSTWSNSLTSLSGAFNGCTNLVSVPSTLPSGINNLSYMFQGASQFNQDISTWNTSNLTDTNYMFYLAIKFNHNLSNWDVGNITSANSMLSYCGLSVSNYNNLLNGWALQAVQQNVTLGTTGLYYNATGKVGRDILTNTFNWGIYGDTNSSQSLLLLILRFNITSPGTIIKVPLPDIDPNNHYFLVYKNDWGDGTNYDANSISHTYNFTGSYNLYVNVIYGNVTSFGNGSVPWDTFGNLMEVLFWSNVFTSFSGAFNGCFNLGGVPAILPPNVTDLSYLFQDAKNVNGATTSESTILNWNTSKVTDMSFMFNGALLINLNLGNWNITSVTFMTGMLDYTILSVSNYNLTLSGWAAQTVQSGVILGATGLHYDSIGADAKDILTSSPKNWDIYGDNDINSNVIALNFVIYATTTITLPLPLPGGSLFYNINWGDNTTQDSSLITHIYDSSAFPRIFICTVNTLTGTVSQFGNGVSQWVSGAGNLTQVFNWSDSLTSLSGAFNGCNSLVSVPAMLPINVDDLSYTFNFAGQFNQDLSTWDTSGIKFMQHLFDTAAAFNGYIETWNTSSVTNMDYMFNFTPTFNQNLGNWDITSVNFMSGMLDNSNLSMTNYSFTLSGWATQTVQSGVSLGATGLYYNNNGIVGHTILTDPPNNWIITGDTYIALPNLIYLTFDFKASFFNPVTITLPLPTPDSSINYFIEWGDGITEQQVISHTYTHPGPVNVVVLANVTTFGNGATPWDTSGGVYLTNVVYWDSSFTSFSGAFNGCTSLISVPSTLPVNVTNVSYMFQGAYSFNQDLSLWNISNITDASGMLDFTNLSITNYNKLLNGWALQAVQPGVILGAAGLYYDASGAVGRDILTNTFNWDIYGDSLTTFSTLIELFFNFNYDNITVILPLPLPGGSLFYNINWGDGQLYDSSSITHNFTSRNSTNVIVNVSGDISYFGIGGDSWGALGGTYLTKVIYWNNLFKSLSGAFNGCTNLVSVPTILPTNVDNLSYIFQDAHIFNQYIGAWDTSGVKDMSFMFSNARLFNQGLSGWSTSSVTNMEYMFYSALRFNKPIGSWDTSQVTNMGSMFYIAQVFNQPIGNWNTGNVRFMDSMFNNAYVFNQDLSGWNTSNLTNVGGMFVNAFNFNGNISNWDTSGITLMTGMFANAYSFNQPIGEWSTDQVMNTGYMFQSASSFNQSLNGWNTSNIGFMNSMFINAINFNGDITSWDTGNVINMSNMFNNAESFNQPIGLWNTSNVKDMSYMFLRAYAFNQDLSGWDTRKVIDLTGTFTQAKAFNGDITNWKTGNVTSTIDTFLSAESFNQPIGNWDTSNILHMSNMFTNAYVFNQDITQWNTGKVQDMASMFQSAYAFNQPIGVWDMHNVKVISNMFFDASSFSQDIDGWNINSVENLTGAFSGYPVVSIGYANGVYIGKVSNSWSIFNGKVPLNTAGVTKFTGLFSSNGIFNQDITNLNTSAGTDFSYQFYGAQEFNQNINAWDTSNATTMVGMFNGASKFNYDLSGWKTKKVTDMSYMFSDAVSFNGHINNWNTSSVKSMKCMFFDAVKFNQSMDQWDTSGVTNMQGMFYSASSFNQNISTWKTSNVNDMSYMFLQAYNFNQPIDNWNTSKVTTMKYMFSNATGFNQNLGNWDITNVSFMNGMLNNCSINVANYSLLLNGWAAQTVKPNITLGALGLRFDSSGVVGRNILISPPNNWTIIGDNIDGYDNIINLVFNIDTSNTTITLPLPSPSGSLTYSNFWGDNTIQPNSITHTYTSPGSYIVNVDVSGNVTHFGNGSTEWGTSGGIYLIDVISWGNSLTSLSGAFNGCTSLISVPPTLPSGVTNLSYVFQGATHFNQELTWNISNITNLTGALNNCGFSVSNYNNLLNTWVLQTLIPSLTLGATGLYYDENGASGRSLLTSSPNNWVILDNGPLKYIIGLIFNITASNTIITLPLPTSGILYVNDWGDGTTQSSSITHIYTSPGFYTVIVDASGTLTQFGKGSIAWDTTGGVYLTSVTAWGNSLISLSGAFNGCTNLVSVPSTLPSGIADISYLFQGASQFNQDLSGWNTSNLTDTNYAFYNATQFNQNLGIWNVTNVTTASGMLNNCGISIYNYSLLLNGWAAQTLQPGVTLGATSI